MKIALKECFGINPNGWLGDSHEVQKCHHNFPKFPFPETTILRRYNEEELKDTIFMKIQAKTLNIIKNTYFVLNYRRNGAF